MDDSFELYNTLPADQIEDEFVRIFVKDSLEAGNVQLDAFASIVNAIYTQKTPVFMITRKVLSTLLKNDPNHSRNSANRNKYPALIKMLTNTGFWELLEEQSGSRPAFFEVKDEVLVNALKKHMADDVYSQIIKQRHEDFLKFVDQQSGKREFMEMSGEDRIKKMKKEVEKDLEVQ